MNRSIARRAIAEIAKREGIKKSDVKREISKAIMEGYNNKETQYKWNAIFGNTIPSPEIFIVAIGGIVEK